MFMGLHYREQPGRRSEATNKHITGTPRTFSRPIRRGSWMPMARRSAAATNCASADGAMGAVEAGWRLLGTRLASAACNCHDSIGRNILFQDDDTEEITTAPHAS